jgi:hypothetical protein
MALLDFPSGPTQDVTTYSLNGNTWKWNGTSWVAFNNLSLSSQVSGILAVQYGGTGFGGTYTKGDVLYALSSNTFGKLAAGTAGSVLSIDISGDLYWKKDDTGSGTVGAGTSGGFAYYTSASNISSGSGFSYISGTNNVRLTSGILSLSGSTIDSGTWAGTAISLAYGGTNANLTASAGAVVYSTSTAFALSAVGTAGSILQSANTGAPIWVGQNTLIVGGATTAANIQGGTIGALPYQSAANTTGFIAYPGAGYALTSVGGGTSSVWQALNTMLVGNATNSTTATNANNVAVNSTTGAGSSYLVFVSAQTGNLPILTNASVTVDASTSTITATLAGTATTATRVGITTQSSSGSSYLYYGSAASGSVALGATTDITVNASTGTIIAKAFTGLATTATLANNVGITTQSSAGASYIYFGSTASGSAALGATTTIYVTASTGTIVATTFSGTATSAQKANNIIGGLAGSIPYQSGADSTTFLNNPGAGYALTTVSATSVAYQTISSLAVGSAFGSTNVTTVDGSSSNVYLVGNINSSAGQTQLRQGGSSVYVNGSTLNATNFSGLASSASNIFGGVASAGASIHIQTAVNTTSFLAHPGSAGQALTTTPSGLVYGALTSLAVTSLSAGLGINVSGSTGNVTVSNIGATQVVAGSSSIVITAQTGGTGRVSVDTAQNITTTGTPTFAEITINGGTSSTLTSVGSQPTSMVNKQYVDNLAAGLDIHGSVRIVITSAIGASYYQPGYGIGNTATGAYLTSIGNSTLLAYDGVTIGSTGITQRVLVVGGLTATGKTSINGSALVTPADSNLVNGIYYVGSVGSGSSQWYLYRATDTDDNTELTGGTFTFVEEGTTYKDSAWVCTNDTTNLGPIQFGSTAISFSQFAGAAAFTSGQGLTKVGNTFAANINLYATGAYAGIGYTQFNIGGASVGGVADTGYYPTFSVRTSGTTVSGSALLTLNSDGFSLVGSTNTPRTITVTGSDITLTGGGNTLTLTGSISLPSPTQYGIAYGSSATAVAFLTAGGTGASVLTQTLNNNPVYLGQSQLVVGGATTAGIATSAAQVNTDAVTATRYLVGTVLNTASGSTQLSTGSGITIGNNLLTSAGIAVTGSTASTSTTTGALVVSGGVGIGGSLWTNGSTISSISGVSHQNGAITGGTWAGTAVSLTYGGTNANLTASAGAVVYSTSTAFALSAVGTAGSILQSANTGAPIWVGQATLSVGTATSSASVVTDAVTATRYLIGTVLNSASTGGTVLSTGSGITIGNNLLTSGGIAVTNTTISTSTSTGALTVSGGVGVGLTSYFGQSVVIQGSTASTTSTTGALTVSGGVGIGGSLSVGSYILLESGYGSVTTTPFASVFGKAIGSNATSLMQVKGNDGTVGMGMKAQTGTNSLIYSNGQIDFRVGSTIRDNDVPTGGTTFLSLSTVGVLTATGATGATSTSTGALVVTGGVGIGGSLWTSATNYSSISGLAISNGVVLSGVWAGTAVSLANGGTNANLTASAGAVVYSTSTAFALSAVGTAGSILQSANTGAPIWVGQSSLSVGLATSTSNKINVSTFTGSGTSYLYFGDVVSGYASIGATADITVVASTGTINAKFFSGIATSSTRVGITTSVSSSDLPIVFADTHQPYAALGSSTLLTYQASTGKITNGIWAGTAITTRGGGTGFNTVNANQVLIGAATGNTWAAIASTNLPVACISANPPASPSGAIGATQAGQLWWDSTYGVLKIYYADNDTSQWVDATPVLGSSGGGSSTKRSYVMSFGAGFTPSTGADTISIQMPYAPDNSSQYYYIKRLDYRAETSGTGMSFFIERHTTGNASFSVANRIHSGAGTSFVTASGTFTTSYTLSSTGASFVSSSGIAGSVLSGDYLRLNFSHINSAANMSISMVIEEQ